jgi:hypothetical protein
MFSCSAGKKLLQKTEVLNAKVKFYSLAEKDNKSKIKKSTQTLTAQVVNLFIAFIPIFCW